MPDSIKITAPPGYYIYLLSFQGGDGNSYGCFILQGYHPGGLGRNHVTKLSGSDIVSVTISGIDYIVSGYSSTYLNWSLLVLYGEAPVITV